MLQCLRLCADRQHKANSYLIIKPIVLKNFVAAEGVEPSTASNIGNYYLFFFRLVSDIPVGINIYNEPGVIIPLPCKFRQ